MSPDDILRKNRNALAQQFVLQQPGFWQRSSGNVMDQQLGLTGRQQGDRFLECGYNTMRPGDDPTIQAAVLAERERCAKIAEEAIRRAAALTDKEFADGYSFAGQEIAARIREGK